MYLFKAKHNVVEVFIEPSGWFHTYYSLKVRRQFPISAEQRSSFGHKSQRTIVNFFGQKPSPKGALLRRKSKVDVNNKTSRPGLGISLEIILSLFSPAAHRVPPAKYCIDCNIYPSKPAQIALVGPGIYPDNSQRADNFTREPPWLPQSLLPLLAFKLNGAGLRASAEEVARKTPTKW